MWDVETYIFFKRNPIPHLLYFACNSTVGVIWTWLRTHTCARMRTHISLKSNNLTNLRAWLCLCHLRHPDKYRWHINTADTCHPSASFTPPYPMHCLSVSSLGYLVFLRWMEIWTQLQGWQISVRNKKDKDTEKSCQVHKSGGLLLFCDSTVCFHIFLLCICRSRSTGLLGIVVKKPSLKCGTIYSLVLIVGQHVVTVVQLIVERHAFTFLK